MNIHSWTCTNPGRLIYAGGIPGSWSAPPEQRSTSCSPAQKAPPLDVFVWPLRVIQNPSLDDDCLWKRVSSAEKRRATIPAEVVVLLKVHSLESYLLTDTSSIIYRPLSQGVYRYRDLLAQLHHITSSSFVVMWEPTQQK